MSTDLNNPKKINVLIVGHGNDVEGPGVGGGPGDPAGSWQSLFEIDQENLDAYDDAAKLTNYKDQILVNADLFDAHGRIQDLVFTNCRIATSAGARKVIDAVRDKLGISKVTAGKQYMLTGWRKKDGVWVTEISAAEDEEGKKLVKESTPREDVIYESTAP